MTDRAKSLYFTGTYDANGQPLEYFAAVPARDLDDSDIVALTDEQYADITGAPEGRKPLYQPSKPRTQNDPPDDPPKTAEQLAQEQAANELAASASNTLGPTTETDAAKAPKK